MDDNYLAVLKYNMACCFQRLTKIEPCIKCLEEAIEALNRKVASILDQTNLSFIAPERSVS